MTDPKYAKAIALWAARQGRLPMECVESVVDVKITHEDEYAYSSWTVEPERTEITFYGAEELPGYGAGLVPKFLGSCNFDADDFPLGQFVAEVVELLPEVT